MSTWTLDKVKHNIGKHYFKIINFLMFQSVWLLSVLGQGRFTALALSLIALHFILSPSRISDLKMMLSIAALGIAIDYALMASNIFVFRDGVFPVWLAVLWLAFALSLNHAMSWLPRMSLPMQSLLGAFGGASSYIGGHFLGAVEWGFSLLFCSVVLLVIWALATPAYCFIQRYFDEGAQSDA